MGPQPCHTHRPGESRPRPGRRGAARLPSPVRASRQGRVPAGREAAVGRGDCVSRSLPRQAVRTFDGVRYLFVHATPSDPLYRYLGAQPDDWHREVAGLDVDVVMVGHTHLQFGPHGGRPPGGQLRAASASRRTVTLARHLRPSRTGGSPWSVRSIRLTGPFAPSKPSACPATWSVWRAAPDRTGPEDLDRGNAPR